MNKNFERWLWNMSMGWNTREDTIHLNEEDGVKYGIKIDIKVNKVQPEDTVTYGEHIITAVKGETLQQFANRINKIAGKQVAIVTGNPNDLVKEYITNETNG